MSLPLTNSAAPATSATQPDLSALRVALFSGNYNYVRDGANQALNRLVGHLLRQGAAVRVYSPVVAEPAFAPTGDLVGLPSVALPGRSEYRLPMALGPTARRDLAAFKPNVVHVSSPDVAGHRAVSWARGRHLPVLASVHTRFDTYPRYYNMAWIEPVLTAMLRRFYRRCDALVAPSESMAQVLRDQRMNYDISLWSRGVDRDTFNPGRRDAAWRQSLGIADDEVVIGFLGRLVMEKGLDVFADTIDDLTRRGFAHRVIVIGEGPARAWFDAGVKVTLSTDDPGVFGVDLLHEYGVLAAELDFTPRELLDVSRRGLDSLFLPAAEKAALADEFEHRAEAALRAFASPSEP